MSTVEDFKKFALRGNVMDLAAGVIIGAAFGKVVSAIVDKVLMPPLGLLIGGVHFSELRFMLKAADATGKGEIAIGYGDVIDAALDFLIVAFTLFMVVTFISWLSRVEERTLARKKASEPPAPPPPIPPEQQLLREIRDLLADKSN